MNADHALLYSTLSVQEFRALPSEVMEPITQIVGHATAHLYPTIQAALGAAFETHKTHPGITFHLIVIRDTSEKELIVRLLQEEFPERAWIYLFFTRLSEKEMGWWQQFVSPVFAVGGIKSEDSS